MNWWMLTGAAMAMFCAVGHAIVGGDRFYRPIRSALPDEVLAGLFAGMWHLITVHFVLSAILLGALSIGRFSNEAAASSQLNLPVMPPFTSLYRCVSAAP